MSTSNEHTPVTSNGTGPRAPHRGSPHDLVHRFPEPCAPVGDTGERARPEALDDTGLVWLSKLIKRPELLRLPDPVVEHLAWPGRLTLLAAREKTGKSTLVTAATAAVSIGSSLFGGRGSHTGPVLYYNLEEHVGDLARRLMRWEADPNRVVIRNHLDGVPMDQLREDVRRIQPMLVVIDSLTQLASYQRHEPATDLQWGRFMGEIIRISRRSNAAFLTLHHGRRSDGRYRGSSAIGAAADVILEMSCGASTAERRIEATGRFGPDEFAFRLVETEDGPYYELAEDDQPLDERILRYLRRHPGASGSEVRNQVRGAAAEISRVLHQLQAEGLIENRGDGQSHAWHVALNT